MARHRNLIPRVLVLLFSTLPLSSARAFSTGQLQQLKSYEIISDLALEPSKDLRTFAPKQGIFVTARDTSGHPQKALIRVLAPHPGDQIEVVGDFNNWGKSGSVFMHRDPGEPRYMIAELTNVKHGMQYRLKVNGQELLDPASLAYSTPGFDRVTLGTKQSYLNSVFWDITGEGAPQTKSTPIDLTRSAVAISEVEVSSLAGKWPYQGRLGPPKKENTYAFITNSGVIDKLKSWGMNAVELLPPSASEDGKVWAKRYLVFSLFGIDAHYGSPTEFARMVDAFNSRGMGVIIDAVIGHYPKDGNVGDRNLAPVGLQNWRNESGGSLYGDRLSEWGTNRYNYEDPDVCRYLIDGILNLIKLYHVSGIRIDNWGGIQALPGGANFLRQMVAEVRAYAPKTLVIAESFGDDNSITRHLGQDGGFGANIHNNGDFFGFIDDNAQRRTEELDMERLRSLLRNPWDKKELATLNYITNHDEASNRRQGATGAYFAQLIGGGNGGNWEYVMGKTRTFAALAMLSGAYYIDMPQLRLLQLGSFYSDPAVDWSRLSDQHVNQGVWPVTNFMADMTRYFVANPAFAFANMHPNIENAEDDVNRVISLQRINFETGKRVYALINLGHHDFPNQYCFGADGNNAFRVKLDSQYANVNQLVPLGNGMQGKSHSLCAPKLEPYGVVVLEEQ